MKKILSFMLILIFSFSTLCFAGENKVSTQNKIVRNTGIIVVTKNFIGLKMSKNVLILTGQTKILLKYNGKKVSINGYMSNKKFVVMNFTLIKPTVKAVPTPPVVSKNLSLSELFGIISESTLEGLHYEITTKSGKFILVGYDPKELAKFVGKSAKVTGKIATNQNSIYQSGTLFDVVSITTALPTSTPIPIVDVNKTKKKIIEVSGIVVIDAAKGAHIGLLDGLKLYGLSGAVDGIEKLNGKEVKVTGYIPDLKYIRRPDYIMFEVTSYAEIK